MSKSYPKLNFPSINLRAKRHDDGESLLVWSAPRSCYLLLTPEEWVRRHVVEYLCAEYKIPMQCIIEEYPVLLNGQGQRADVVVMNREQAMILVECKAPDVKISNETLSQAVRYNSVVGARYIILTNGLKHLCFELQEGEYKPLSSLPKFTHL